jgi:hypothetical protein
MTSCPEDACNNVSFRTRDLRILTYKGIAKSAVEPEWRLGGRGASETRGGLSNAYGRKRNFGESSASDFDDSNM